MDKNNPDAAVFKPKKMRYARLLSDRPVLPNPNDFWLPLRSVTRNPHREPASTGAGWPSSQAKGRKMQTLHPEVPTVSTGVERTRGREGGAHNRGAAPGGRVLAGVPEVLPAPVTAQRPGRAVGTMGHKALPLWCRSQQASCP